MKNKEKSPERTCVCTKRKDSKENLIRLVLKNNEYVFDKNQKEQSRGIYIDKTTECLEKLSKHKKYNVSPDELLKILKYIENEKKISNKDGKLMDILNKMKMSEFLVMGIDENLKQIENEKVKLLVLPKNINEKYIRKFQKLCDEKSIKIIWLENQKDLLKVFFRDVKAVGISNKKVVSGIMKKLEVTL